MLNKDNVFFWDACGALLSLLLFSLVLPIFQYWLGMPNSVHYILAVYAFFCLTYSFCCHRFVKNNRFRWLAGIIFVNTIYCFLTTLFVLSHWNQLKPLGFVYFAGDIGVILLIVWLESRVLKSFKSELLPQ